MSLLGKLALLENLEPAERFVFIEYHYYNTHMKVLSEVLKVHLSRTYAILYRAEDKINKLQEGDTASEA